MTTPDSLRVELTNIVREYHALGTAKHGHRLGLVTDCENVLCVAALRALAAAPTYTEADRQAAYKAGWDDARAVIADRHVTTRAEINEALANDPRVRLAKERDQG